MRTKVKQKPRMVTVPLIGLIISGEDEDDYDDDVLITRVLLAPPVCVRREFSI